MGISVVIPAYNSAKTIRATIESVLAQTEPPDEIIVVDDGSTDGTADIAASYEQVKVLRQPNRGPGPARALGTLQAQSDYVAYVDADDWFLPNWLCQARQIIESDDVSFLFADLKRGEPGSDESTWGPRNSNNFTWFTVYSLCAKAIDGKHPVYRFSAEDGWELFLRGFPVYPSTVVVKRSAIIEAGNWSGDYRRAEDLDMWLRLSKRYPCHYFDKVVSILGLHDVNRDKSGYILLQSQWDVKVLAGCLETAADVDRPRLKRALANRFCQLGWQLRQRGEMVAAREAYVSAMQYGRRLGAAIRWCITFKQSFRLPVPSTPALSNPKRAGGRQAGG